MSASFSRFAGFLMCLNVVWACSANAQQREPPRQEVRGQVKAVDAAAGTISVITSGGREAPGETTYPISKNVEIVTGSSAGRFNIFREAKLADLAPGTYTVLTLSADQKSVDAIMAEGQSMRGELKKVDATLGTISISSQLFRGDTVEDKTFKLAPDTEIAIDDGRGRRYSIREGKVAELVAGSIVTLRLSLDQKQIQSLVAEGPTLFGTVKSVDAAKNSLMLTLRPTRGDEAAEDRVLTVAADAAVLVDDGRGRRLSIKEGKLADVPVGAAINVRLSIDQNSATLIRAEGSSLVGILKAVDAAKNSITISIPRGRGDAPEEKVLTVAEDARLNIEGKEAKLAALKADENGPIVQLRLSLDGKTVQSLISRQGR